MTGPVERPAYDRVHELEREIAGLKARLAFAEKWASTFYAERNRARDELRSCQENSKEK